jgi:hypothetical protein
VCKDADISRKHISSLNKSLLICNICANHVISILRMWGNSPSTSSVLLFFVVCALVLLLFVPLFVFVFVLLHWIVCVFEMA